MKRLIGLIIFLSVGVANAQSNTGDLISLGLSPEVAEQIDKQYSTAVKASQLPATDNTYDLGSAAKSFRSAYIDTAIVFGSGANGQLAAFVPTLAATPVAATNRYLPGLNIIPTNAANNAAFIGAATPVVGQQFRIVNNSGAAQRAKAAGGATLNGATAGGYISIASLATVDCTTASATNQVCTQAVIPTPAGP